MNRTHLLSELDALLSASTFKDYCPNGLQIQGCDSITKIATAVTASRAVIEIAAKWGAHALLVHHGYFWKGEDATIVGIKHGRIAMLLQHNINLIAYHLPLDAHPSLGNNVQLASLLGFKPQGQLPMKNLVWYGQTPCATLGELTQHVERVLGRTPLVLGATDAPVGQLAWCTGAAQDFMIDAAKFGVNTYLSGEVSERTFHEARELGVNYLACGHHATERYGIRALGAYLAAQYGLEHRFIDELNPV